LADARGPDRRKASPSPFEMADCLGKAEALDKIKKGIEKLS